MCKRYLRLVFGRGRLLAHEVPLSLCFYQIRLRTGKQEVCYLVTCVKSHVNSRGRNIPRYSPSKGSRWRTPDVCRIDSVHCCLKGRYLLLHPYLRLGIRLGSQAGYSFAVQCYDVIAILYPALDPKNLDVGSLNAGMGVGTFSLANSICCLACVHLLHCVLCFLRLYVETLLVMWLFPGASNCIVGLVFIVLQMFPGLSLWCQFFGFTGSFFFPSLFPV